MQLSSTSISAKYNSASFMAELESKHSIPEVEGLVTLIKKPSI
jgi:hypothetical protein